MLAQYVENCFTQRKVYQWVEMFHSGRTSVDGEDNALVQEDRQISVTDTADKLDISCGPAYYIESECTAMDLQANSFHGVVTHVIAQDQEIQKCAF